jgi:hypothetical protein
MLNKVKEFKIIIISYNYNNINLYIYKAANYIIFNSPR